MLDAPIEMMLDNLTWIAIPRGEEPEGDLPYATHRGVLEIAGMRLRAYQLSDGKRVIAEADMAAFLEGMLGDPHA